MEAPVSQRLTSLPGATSRELWKELPAHPRQKEAISAGSFLEFSGRSTPLEKAQGFIAPPPWPKEAGVRELRLWGAQGQLHSEPQKELRDMGKLGEP